MLAKNVQNLIFGKLRLHSTLNCFNGRWEFCIACFQTTPRQALMASSGARCLI